MFRLRLLIKNIPRMFSTLSQKSGIERAVIDIKLSRSQDLASFLHEIDISKASDSQLAYILKLAINKSQKSILESLEAKKKFDEIFNEIVNKISKLDPNGIVDLCEFLSNSRLFRQKILPIPAKQKLKFRIIEMISRHSFDRKQIMSIYENLLPQGFYIIELENEIEKIVANPSTLNLKEISQIFVGNGKYLFSMEKNLFEKCMEIIIELSKKGQLDAKYLSKITEILVLEKRNFKNKKLIEKFLEIVEDSLENWNENDLIAIIKFYKKHKTFDRNLLYKVCDIIHKNLHSDHQIDFYIDIVSLLKEEVKSSSTADKVVLSCMNVINSKMSSEYISDANIRKILDLLKPNISLETASLLSKQIYRSKFMYTTSFEALRKASYIDINNNGQLIPLLNFIRIEKFIKLGNNKAENLSWDIQIEILDSILHTKNYEACGMDRIINSIISSLNKWLCQSDDNVIKLCVNLSHIQNKSRTLEALKPMHHIIYNALEHNTNNYYCLWYSTLFYKADPEAWKLFYNKNKNIFSERNFSEAIKLYKGPYEVINYLLRTRSTQTR